MKPPFAAIKPLFAVLALGVGGCKPSIDAAIATPPLAPEVYGSDRDMPRMGWSAEAHPIPGTQGQPAPTGQLTLSAAIKRALDYNPSLKAAFVEIEARHGEEAQAAVKPNPELLATVENFGGTKDRSGFKSAEETLEISQLIELGDKLQLFMLRVTDAKDICVALASEGPLQIRGVPIGSSSRTIII